MQKFVVVMIDDILSRYGRQVFSNLQQHQTFFRDTWPNLHHTIWKSLDFCKLKGKFTYVFILKLSQIFSIFSPWISVPFNTLLFPL